MSKMDRPPEMSEYIRSECAFPSVEVADIERYVKGMDCRTRSVGYTRAKKRHHKYTSTSSFNISDQQRWTYFDGADECDIDLHGAGSVQERSLRWSELEGCLIRSCGVCDSR